jgi:hypothetical protein
MRLKGAAQQTVFYGDFMAVHQEIQMVISQPVPATMHHPLTLRCAPRLQACPQLNLFLEPR